jgi:adenine-specific DNA-methyltransferase
MAAKKRNTYRLARTSSDLLAQQVERLKELFPECVAEGKVDFEKLKASLGEIVDDRPERYSFTWAGKRDAVRLLQVPSRATLNPCPGESVDWETTKNVFIEGENLEVLKLLYKSYARKVKIIYIDPPYNTGNDFIYPDNFADPLDTYLKLTGQEDAEGNRLTSNPETSGRYHSVWLSMMYPRLFVAQQLLREDGLIVVSIDDHEAGALRLLMNEVFGEENFIAQLVWEKGRKNDAKLFSVGHEYMLAYAKSTAKLRSAGIIWREPKPGAQEIWDEYCVLRKELTKDDAVEKALQSWYAKLSDEHPSKTLTRYRHVDKYGPWRDRDISWPGGGGPRYDVIHPRTKKPCKVPERGWGFATSEAMKRQIALGLVVFRADHTQPPFRKAHLRPLPDELDEDVDLELNGDDEESKLVGMQVMPSYVYKQSQVEVKYLRKLMGGKVFDNPKDHDVLARIIKYCTSVDEPGIVVDFFAGSGTTAEAVLDAVREDGRKLEFILAQWPEPVNASTRAGKEALGLGLRTVAEICKERIRRVIKKLKAEAKGKKSLFKDRETPEDLGFRVYKLAESNYRPWRGVEERDGTKYAETMEAFADPLVRGWKPDDVVWEVALKEGYSLSSTVEEVKEHKGNSVWRVTDGDSGQSFFICLDDKLNAATLKALALGKDDLFICRDCSLTDELAANLALQCRLKTI